MKKKYRKLISNLLFLAIFVVSVFLEIFAFEWLAGKIFDTSDLLEFISLVFEYTKDIDSESKVLIFFNSAITLFILAITVADGVANSAVDFLTMAFKAFRLPTRKENHQKPQFIKTILLTFVLFIACFIAIGSFY